MGRDPPWRRLGAAWLAVLVALLAWAGSAAGQASNTGGVTGSPSEPPVIAKLRSNQDRTAASLRDEARSLLATSADPTERAWATFAVAEFENDLENAPASLALLAAVKAEAQRLKLVDLEFAALDREANLLVNRGKSVETDAVLVQMQRLVDDTNDPRMRAQLLHDRGVLERKLGRFDKAQVYFEQARDIQRRLGDPAAVAREINSIGMLQGRTGKFSEAVLAHNEALELSRKAGDRAETARSLRLLGVLYRNLDDEERGSQYLREALDHVEERNKREAIALHGELARSLALLGRVDDAAAHAEQAVTLAEASGSPPNKVNAYTRMAELRLDQGDVMDAERWSSRASELFDQVAIRDQILLRVTRTRVLAAKRDTAAALNEAQLTLEATRRIGDRILERAALDLLAEQQLRSGDAANAFLTRKAHQALDKDLAMDMAGRRIAVLESSLEHQRTEAERELLSRDNRIQLLQLERQRLIGIGLAIGVIALLAMAALLWSRSREAERNNERLTLSRDELARLHQALVDSSSALERLAHTDPLTGLSNRRAAVAEFDQRLQRARDLRRPLSAILIDIDHFKQINDRYGHQVGDDVLREFAQRLRSALPPGTTLGRWGGEEFIAVVEDCALPDGIAVAEKARRALADRPIVAGDQSIAVTASFGVAAVPGRVDTMDPLIGAADNALYRAKRGGRNRVEAADAESVTQAADVVDRMLAATRGPKREP